MATPADQTAAFNAWQSAVAQWVALEDQTLSGTNPALAQQIANAENAMTSAGTRYFIAVGPAASPTFVQLFHAVNGAIDRLRSIYATPGASASVPAGKQSLDGARGAFLSLAPNGVPPAPPPPVVGPTSGILPPALQAQFQAILSNPPGFDPAAIAAFAKTLSDFGYTTQAAQMTQAQAASAASPLHVVGPTSGILPDPLNSTYQAILANPTATDPASIDAFAQQLDAFGYATQAAQMRTAAASARAAMAAAAGTGTTAPAGAGQTPQAPAGTPPSTTGRDAFVIAGALALAWLGAIVGRRA